MKSQILHRICQETNKESHNAIFWYDNPDIADILFATFNDNEFSGHVICSLAYNYRIGKGLYNFKEYGNGIWEANLVDSISDKIIYHPILTISTLNKRIVYAELDSILTGIDGIGYSQIAKLILIPILMHYNHFGVIAVAPIKGRRTEGCKANVFLFNPFGDESTYKDEERLICKYLNTRYDTEVVCNKIKYQYDGNQCGPFVIQFVENAARLAIKGEDFTKVSFEANSFEMEILGARYNKSRVIELRESHAKRLFGQSTNYSLDIMNQIQLLLNNQLVSAVYRFQMTRPISVSQAASGHKLYLHNSGRILHDRSIPPNVYGIIRKVNNIDAFEIQPAMLDILLTSSKELKLDIERGNRYESMIVTYNEQKVSCINSSSNDFKDSINVDIDEKSNDEKLIKIKEQSTFVKRIKSSRCCNRYTKGCAIM